MRGAMLRVGVNGVLERGVGRRDSGVGVLDLGCEVVSRWFQPEASERGGRVVARRGGRARLDADVADDRRPVAAERPVLREAVTSASEPVLEARDPRWVLALRTAEALEGPILRPEKRQRLLRLGRVMGLSPFAANLVIAVVQDRARRGVVRDDLTHAAAADLALIPQAQPRRGNVWATTAAVAALLVMQALVLLWLLG